MPPQRRARHRPAKTGIDPDFDRRLADPRLAAEPLHLMMAGLVAARHGLGTLLSLGRLDLALELACWERDRLARLAGDRGVNDKLFLHLVGTVTLRRGLERGELRALIDEERAALPYERQVERDPLADAVRAALPVEAEGGGERLWPPAARHHRRDFLPPCPRHQPRPRPERADRSLPRSCAGNYRPASGPHRSRTSPVRPAELVSDATQRSRRREAKLLHGWLGEANPAFAWLDRLVAGTDDIYRLMSMPTRCQSTPCSCAIGRW